MEKNHIYTLQLDWTGNKGLGTKNYNAFERSFSIQIKNKPTILGSSDPAFLGDPTKYNPEEMFLASISSCHMLWYLHLCAVNGITVLSYQDQPLGTMLENKDGSGMFTSVVLKISITLLEYDKIDFAQSLHEKANKYCFIANSLNFKVKHECIVTVK
ncbi:OsmC family protein [Rhizosphaericola mali]|uniref:OsmC family peroxiredoxin n=1 Tax=Rhizosphaericola mali TaxID=2545455 RepID=A0A5P2FYH7_9BACT|nr:OsmC family protein [Rhizosphaericola mali]QES88235.1 OsmC family peroxiredoxin [Rhizosphaericola mali]